MTAVPRQITRWVASDGSEHETEHGAVQYEKRRALSVKLSRDVYLQGYTDPDDIMKWVYDNLPEILESMK